jgi:hypothetical protein
MGGFEDRSVTYLFPHTESRGASSRLSTNDLRKKHRWQRPTVNYVASMAKIAQAVLRFPSSAYRWSPSAVLLVAYCALALPARAQGNYEIQVYGSDLVSPGSTMVELHSNYTASGTRAVAGSRFAADSTEPTTDALHETVEITQGFTDWFESGFYVFTSAHSGFGYEWVGDHIRPRVAIPERWHWPVGLSLSNEIGYQRARFSPDTWTWEIRPIVDKQLGPWYLSFNPTLDRSWHGPSVNKGVEFSPNFKFSYNLTKQIAAGLEYYGSVGDLTGFDPFREQQQDFFPAIDLNVSPNWEFNFGVGVGVTRSTDHLIVKCIIGRRFSFGRHR